MTRKEAAGVIKFEKACVLRQDTPRCNRDCKKCDLLLPTEDVLTAYDMAIKALEQEPCEDCISRKAVVEYIKASDADLGHDSENEFAIEDILNMPPVTPVACIATVKFSKEDMQELVNEKMKDIMVERKTGHWIDHSDEGYVECSECGSCTNCDGNINNLHFCFSCGAKMEEEESK